MAPFQLVHHVQIVRFRTVDEGSLRLCHFERTTRRGSHWTGGGETTRRGSCSTDGMEIPGVSPLFPPGRFDRTNPDRPGLFSFDPGVQRDLDRPSLSLHPLDISIAI
eukprot:scaffold64_cov338-Pavlova_lutheri.AAC.43